MMLDAHGFLVTLFFVMTRREVLPGDFPKPGVLEIRKGKWEIS